jgi:hypothetical protein
VYESGALIKQKSVNADGSYDIAYFNVSGLGYSSYEDLYSNAGVKSAEAQDMNNGAGALVLSASNLSIASSASQQSVTIGSDTFAINPHGSEAITASGRNDETFAYGPGFGQSAITGFLATGAAHDVIQLNVSMFNYLSPTMTQAQDAAALLGRASQTGANVVIADSAGDTLTLNATTKATLTANSGDLKFV